MTLIAIFLETTNQTMLFEIVPEPLSLLLFGVGLVALTLILRWVFKRLATVKDEKVEIKR